MATPLAITMGDPAGIGAEITVKALESDRARALGPVVVVGSASVLEGARAVCGTVQPIVRVADPA